MAEAVTIADPMVFQRLEQMPMDETFDVGPGVVGVYSARSPAKDTENEDAALLIPLGPSDAVVAVADGVGGRAAGAEAADAALRELVACVTACAGDDERRSAILDGLEAGNRAVCALDNTPATTIAVLDINGRVVRPYHAGDTMMLVVGQRGRLRYQTLPHSPVGYALESGLIDEEEAIHHEDRHLVTNVLGCQDMRIEIGPPMELQSRDTVLIASDGVFDNLHVAEIVEIVRAGQLDDIVERLATRCHEQMLTDERGEPSKPDDVTFLVYRPT